MSIFTLVFLRCSKPCPCNLACWSWKGLLHRLFRYGLHILSFLFVFFFSSSCHTFSALKYSDDFWDFSVSPHFTRVGAWSEGLQGCGMTEVQMTRAFLFFFFFSSFFFFSHNSSTPSFQSVIMPSALSYVSRTCRDARDVEGEYKMACLRWC